MNGAATLKSALLWALQLAEQSLGYLPPEEREEDVARIKRIRALVEAGNEYDRLRRRIQLLRVALEQMSDFIGKALAADGGVRGAIEAEKGDRS